MSYQQREGVKISLHSSFTPTADGGVWLPPGERARTPTVHKAAWGFGLSGRITRIENPL